MADRESRSSFASIPTVLDAVQRWANDDLRSLNAQIEFLLRRAAQQSGRLRKSRQAAEALNPASSHRSPNAQR